MPYNHNPWVSELLTWHGQNLGGVRVPFHATMGKPLHRTVETPLITRIRQLARGLLNDAPSTPRWVFLIGGPGNGKSEAVETFLEELDFQANSNGRLINIAKQEFSPGPLARRRIDISQDQLPNPVLQKQLRRLIIIQDASAVDKPDQMAEQVLIDDLAELITSPLGSEPVFICCANRGLVARACSRIKTLDSHHWLSEITDLLSQLLTATGLGPEALSIDRPQCWPLEEDERFAAWPLDLDSIVTADADMSPFEQMIDAATTAPQWEGNGRCGDCTARDLCPFYANSKSLRNQDRRLALLKILRHGEMAVGQRWNFRDLFSLCAELIVGQDEDFSRYDAGESPCSWVHERADEILYGRTPPTQLQAAWELALHLYSQALFPVWFNPADEDHLDPAKLPALTQSIVQLFAQRDRPSNAQVRNWLPGAFAKKLDPARATPPTPESVLRRIEDEFAQSVRQGASVFKNQLIPLIHRLLELMAKAEDEWGEIVRESGRARETLGSIRILSSILIKRYLGVSEGEYLNNVDLAEYEAIFVSEERLWDTVGPLRAILSPEDAFTGSLIRVFGQPSLEPSVDISVTHPLGMVMPQIASESTDSRPGHDVPWFEVDGHQIPLTFDLYVALQAHSSGAQIASFAPHTRAAIDRVRNSIAGVSARNAEGILGGGVSINIGNLGFLTPTVGGNVAFKAGGTHS